MIIFVVCASAFDKVVMLLDNHGYAVEDLVILFIGFIMLMNAIILAFYFYGLIRIRQMFKSVQISLDLKTKNFCANYSLMLMLVAFQIVGVLAYFSIYFKDVYEVKGAVRLSEISVSSVLSVLLLWII